MNLQSTDFELFGLTQQFAQDSAALDARWKQLQREVHPDKFAAQGSAAQRIAMQWSVRVNEAYRRLKDPLRRATYLCELGGSPVNAQSNTAMPAEFLLQQMHWREQLDDAHDAQSLQALQDTLDASQRQLIEACAQQIDAQRDFGAAAQTVRSLMFIEKFSQDLELAFDRLES